MITREIDVVLRVRQIKRVTFMARFYLQDLS